MTQQQHIAIQLRTGDPLALSIQKKLDNVSYQSTNTESDITIFRVPSHIRERNKNFYEPRVVSIGPYHRGREDLKCMEDEKLRYVWKMLYENPDVTLEDYLEELRKLESEARKCYYESVEMKSDDFIEMLLYDACFIIQLIVNWCYPDFDIISEIAWNIPLIKSDLLMLENQIPFFVLQRVFDLYSRRDEDTTNLISLSSDNSMTSEFDKAYALSEDGELEKATLFDCLVPFLQHGNETFSVPEGDNPCYHLLDFYYQCYMRTQVFPTKQRNKFLILFKILGKKLIKVFPLISSFKKLTMRRHRLLMIAKYKPRMIPCATELQEAGITFKKAKAATIFSIHFSNGVLTIPYSSFDEARRPQIMNLIAFEQCNGKKIKPLTSYAVFMDCIVNTQRDLLVLKQNGIIENKLANEKTAEFFYQLRYCCYLDYDNHYLGELFKKVEDYCNSASRWDKYKVKLHQDYFSNPWSIISLIAAIVALLLTFLQTLYSVKAYYHP